MTIPTSDITVVIQGSIRPHRKIKEKNYVRSVVASVKKHLPGANIILSTWKGENVPPKLSVNDVVYSDDPGMHPRGESPTDKPNNINRQIVSSFEGIKKVTTTYALKLRSDNILIGNGFLDYFGWLNKFEEKYRVVEERILIRRCRTRKPKGKYLTHPFQVADQVAFGLTRDIYKLYDIPLVSDYDFKYFLHYPHLPRFANFINRYGPEQSLVIGFLRKNGMNVPCEYCTHVNDEIIMSSNRHLVNNFLPLSDRNICIAELKNITKPYHIIKVHKDSYTTYQWLAMYKNFCDNDFPLEGGDEEALAIKKIDAQLRIARGAEAIAKFLPQGIGDKIRAVMKTRKKLLHRMMVENL